jgi:hypothetical protein
VRKSEDFFQSLRIRLGSGLEGGWWGDFGLPAGAFFQKPVDVFMSRDRLIVPLRNTARATSPEQVVEDLKATRVSRPDWLACE